MRFKVRLRGSARCSEFDQMAFIDLKPAATSGSTWTATIGMSPQQPTIAYAYLFPGDSGTDLRSCDPLPVTVLRRQDSLRLDVPVRCVPREAARIKITSYTGYFRSDAGGPWSKTNCASQGAICSAEPRAVDQRSLVLATIDAWQDAQRQSQTTFEHEKRWCAGQAFLPSQPARLWRDSNPGGGRPVSTDARNSRAARDHSLMPGERPPPSVGACELRHG